jgi:hypothetical protein
MPKIDYAVRPAKTIERKMLTEALARISKLEMPERFRYVGFGALYFRDFYLFHRVLGISDMFSIEHNTGEEERFEFNRPFACVKMRFGECRTELPKIPLDEKKNIVWLDYEKHLTKDILADIAHVCGKAVAGSIIVVTVNAQAGDFQQHAEESGTDAGEDEGSGGPGPQKGSQRQDPLERLKKDLPGRVPVETQTAQLAGWGTANLFRRIIENEISETLTARNGVLIEDDRISYLRLFDFHYSDGARMLTTGGILYSQNQTPAVQACGFEELAYCNQANHPYLIPAPKLTYKERRHLDLQLPQADLSILERQGVPEKDVEEYSKVYRYFPHFSEVDL